jgi:hypothetical protein
MTSTRRTIAPDDLGFDVSMNTEELRDAFGMNELHALHVDKDDFYDDEAIYPIRQLDAASRLFSIMVIVEVILSTTFVWSCSKTIGTFINLLL